MTMTTLRLFLSSRTTLAGLHRHAIG